MPGAPAPRRAEPRPQIHPRSRGRPRRPRRQQRPEHPVGEDLERPRTARAPEVQREDAPDAVGEEPVPGAAPDSAAASSDGRYASRARGDSTLSRCARCRAREQRREVLVASPGRRPSRRAATCPRTRSSYVGRRPTGRCPSARAPSRGRRAARARTPPTGRRRAVVHATDVTPGSAWPRHDRRRPRRRPGARPPSRSSSARRRRRRTVSRCTMRACASSRSLSTSNAPSLKIGQFW